MPELLEPKSKVIHAAIGCKPEYVRVLDWEGKSLTFILADEIRPPAHSFFPEPEENPRSEPQ
jgi:hypothetical protein